MNPSRKWSFDLGSETIRAGQSGCERLTVHYTQPVGLGRPESSDLGGQSVWVGLDQVDSPSYPDRLRTVDLDIRSGPARPGSCGVCDADKPCGQSSCPLGN